MRKILLLWILFFPLTLFSQDTKNIRKKSYYTFVYRIPADSTEKYLRQDSIPVDVYLQKTPDHTSLTDRFDETELPVGHYLLLSVDDNKIRSAIHVNTNLLVYVVNNSKNIQLAVRNKNGIEFTDPRGWIRNKPLRTDKNSGTLVVNGKPKEDDIVKIIAGNDTVFLNLSVDRDAYNTVAKQKWRIFKRSTLGRIITYIPDRVWRLIKNQRTYKRYAAA
jgi:alpha-2-macroglobulin